LIAAMSTRASVFFYPRYIVYQESRSACNRGLCGEVLTRILLIHHNIMADDEQSIEE